MTLTVSVLVRLCAFADKSAETLAGLLSDCALARSVTMMPPLNERTNDKQVNPATMWARLILARLNASEAMMPYSETATRALLINRARGFEFVISISFTQFETWNELIPWLNPPLRRMSSACLLATDVPETPGGHYGRKRPVKW